MNIESQVVSFELAKRLKEIGVKQEGIFFWIKSLNPKAKWNLSMIGGFNETYHSEKISAFTVSELISMLRHHIKYDICIPLNVNIADFLGGKLIELHEEDAERN